MKNTAPNSAPSSGRRSPRCRPRTGGAEQSHRQHRLGGAQLPEHERDRQQRRPRRARRAPRRCPSRRCCRARAPTRCRARRRSPAPARRVERAARAEALVDSRASTSGIASSPIGTFSQKIHCHAIPCVTAPPTTGPPSTARPVMPPKTPSARPRRSGGKPRSAAPAERHDRSPRRRPERRARRSASRRSAPARTRPTPLRTAASPAANSRRRPNRSPSADAGHQQHGEAQRVRVHGPLELLDRGAQVHPDRRQRGRHDERVERHHQRRDRRRRQHPCLSLRIASPPHGRCVSRLRHGRAWNSPMNFAAAVSSLSDDPMTRSGHDRDRADPRPRGRRAGFPRADRRPTGASSSCTATGSSARCRTPRTCSRRRCWRPGAGLTSSRSAPRCAPGCTDRDQPLPERAARRRPPPAASRGLSFAPPTPTRPASSRGSSPTPTRCSRELPDTAPGPDARYETQGDGRARVRHRAPAPAAPPARGARPARRARLPRGRGRRHARHDRGVGQQRPATRPRDARARPRPPAASARRYRARPRARAGRAVRRRVRERRTERWSRC